ESYGMFNPDFDKAFLAKMFEDAYKNKNLSEISTLLKVPNALAKPNAFDVYANKLIEQSDLKFPHQIFELLEKSPEKIFKLNDPLIQLVRKLSKIYEHQEQLRQNQEAELNILLAKLVEVKMLMQNTSFIPDANATLRFTYGYVRGYWPNDGVYNKPFTTLTGMLEKADNTDYFLPKQYRQFEEGKEFEGFEKKDLNDIPVDFLYNLDTTGGNSGSPVMNDKGELVGVNFDRAYTATINDYAWNENYSRSVAVDIRYVLWVTKKVAGADFLLKEMGI
ncbi:MAG: S46 family peptidase, partial [Bacteroidetes bacterium]|nr:S46 family peptidase [Bacteroidota bacterium]